MGTLMSNGWPYFFMPEQLRVRPGGFDLVNQLFYDNTVEDNGGNVVTTAGLTFEKWALAYSKVK